jgi:hypothetical protein
MEQFEVICFGEELPMAWPVTVTAELSFEERLSEAQKKEILKIVEPLYFPFAFEVQTVNVTDENGVTTEEDIDVLVAEGYANYSRVTLLQVLEKLLEAAPLFDDSYLAFTDLDEEDWFFELQDGVFVEIEQSYYYYAKEKYGEE